MRVSVRVALDREHMLERRPSRIAASSRIAIARVVLVLLPGFRPARSFTAVLHLISS
jgi:hypothetical protein